MPYKDETKQREAIQTWEEQHKDERREAAKERMRQFRAEHPERNRETQKRFHEAHPEYNRDKLREYYREYRSRPGYRERQRALRAKNRAALIKEIYAAYGNQCSCCGESESKFLTIDHIHNNGAEHTKALFGSKHATIRFYYWLRRQGFPKDDFQLLCANCNFGKMRNGGTCPHKALE